MNEIWKDIKDYECSYQVSSLGRIRSLDRYVGHRWGGQAFKKGKIKKTNIGKNGYMLVRLSSPEKSKTHTVHRLVAKAFISNTKNKPMVNHKDGNRLNNKVENLEWATAKENINHGAGVELCSKKIFRYDLEGNLICTYKSANSLRETLGLWPGNITAVCRGVKKSYLKNIWSYKPLSKEEVKERFKETTHRKIYQYSKDKTLINVFNGFNELTKSGFINKKVTSVCRGKDEYYRNNIWSYERLH